MDLGVPFREPEEMVLGPSTPLYSLPDDRNALVAVGTTRLPLGRHDCARMLWRLFDGLSLLRPEFDGLKGRYDMMYRNHQDAKEA